MRDKKMRDKKCEIKKCEIGEAEPAILLATASRMRMSGYSQTRSSVPVANELMNSVTEK